MEKQDDIQGLPNVDLGPVIDDIKKTTQTETQVQTTQNQTQDLDLGQFKNPKDLLKSYKEIQAWATKISQEKKEQEKRIGELQEQLDIAKYQPPIESQNFNMNNQLQPNEPQYMTREEFATSRIAEVLEEEHIKDGKPDPEFRERYAYAQMMAQEYPQLARSPMGVKKLFELGDKRRVDNLKRNASKALESIFGGPLGEEETQRLIKLVKGDKATQTQQFNTNAYMPDTSTSTKSGQNQNQIPNSDLKIKQSVEKGDVDGVIQGMFENILTAE